MTKLVGSTGTIDAFKRIVRGLDEIREKGDDQDKQIAERIYTQLRDGECSTSAAARMVEEVRSNFGPKPTKSPKSVPTVKDAVMTSLNLNAPRIKSQKPRKEGGRGKLRIAA